MFALIGDGDAQVIVGFLVLLGTLATTLAYSKRADKNTRPTGGTSTVDKLFGRFDRIEERFDVLDSRLTRIETRMSIVERDHPPKEQP